MLQEISDNGTHRDRPADSRDPHFQTADTADDQFNLHARRGSLIQGCDNPAVAQGIHLCDDSGRLARQRVLRLPRNQIEKLRAQPQRRERQFIPGKRLRVAGKHVKHRSRVLTDSLMAGENTTVGVELCSRIVVIAGSQMYIASDSVLLAAHHKRDFAVRL